LKQTKDSDTLLTLHSEDADSTVQKTKRRRRELEESKKIKYLQAQEASESAWRIFWQKGLEW